MTNKQETRTLNSMSVTDTGKVWGYAVVFDKPSHDLGGFIEYVDRRALDNCDMSGCVAMWNHKHDQPLASVANGTLNLTVDDIGLRYEFEPIQTSYGKDVKMLIESGEVRGSSFGFIANKDKWERRDGQNVRTLTDISVMIDVSPVTKPAYPDTTVAMRSMEESLNETPDAETDIRSCENCSSCSSQEGSETLAEEASSTEAEPRAAEPEVVEEDYTNEIKDKVLGFYLKN